MTIEQLLYVESRRRELSDELAALGDTRPERRRWLLKCIRVADRQIADFKLDQEGGECR